MNVIKEVDKMILKGHAVDKYYGEWGYSRNRDVLRVLSAGIWYVYDGDRLVYAGTDRKAARDTYHMHVMAHSPYGF